MRLTPQLVKYFNFTYFKKNRSSLHYHGFPKGSENKYKFNKNKKNIQRRMTESVLFVIHQYVDRVLRNTAKRKVVEFQSNKVYYNFGSYLLCTSKYIDELLNGNNRSFNYEPNVMY